MTEQNNIPGDIELRDLTALEVGSNVLGTRISALGSSISRSHRSKLTAPEIQNSVTHLATSRTDLGALRTRLEAMGPSFDAEGRAALRKFTTSFNVVANDTTNNTNKIISMNGEVDDHYNKFKQITNVGEDEDPIPPIPSHWTKHRIQYAYLFCCSAHIATLCGVIGSNKIPTTADKWIFYSIMVVAALAFIAWGCIAKKLNLLMGVFLALDIFGFCTTAEYTEKEANKAKEKEANKATSSKSKRAALGDFNETSTDSTTIFIIVLIFLLAAGALIYYFIKRKKPKPSNLPYYINSPD